MRSFNKGVVLGGLLGAGMMWLNATKKGRELRVEVMQASHDVLETIREEIKHHDEWKHLSKEQFAQRVKEVANEYVVKNPHIKKVKNLVIKVVVSQYQRLRS